jgi:hypothetical protein
MNQGPSSTTEVSPKLDRFASIALNITGLNLASMFLKVFDCRALRCTVAPLMPFIQRVSKELQKESNQG